MNDADHLRSVDVAALCQSAQTLRFLIDSAHNLLPRLQKMCDSSDSVFAVQGTMAWSMRQGELAIEAAVAAAVPYQMRLQACTRLTLRCERCLQPMTQLLDIDRCFGFVRDEATAEKLDLMSDVDLLVQSKTFDAWALLEDELLMALPFSAMHDLQSKAGAAACHHHHQFLDADAATTTPKPERNAALAEALEEALRRPRVDAGSHGGNRE